mmetsp:Transcript_13325/g.22640  ORF Transcript_13325/g.22640 Transcript_13325/m.22640 type:complete len:103 (+) Transcript_13325:1783-2091(+)
MLKHHNDRHDLSHHLRAKIISPAILWGKRHIECNLCVTRGKVDGSMIWGRKAHVRKINTSKVLKAKQRFRKLLEIHRGARRSREPLSHLDDFHPSPLKHKLY